VRPSLHPYRLPLAAPLLLKGVRHAEREGVLLRLEDPEGRVGWGDAAPLPGFSAELLAEASRQLEGLAGWVRDLRPEAPWGDPAHPLHAEIGGLGLVPSAQFALDLALLDLAAQASGRTLAALLHPDPEVSLPLNALLAGEDPEATLREASRLAALGYRTLKVKLGRRPVAEEVALVRALQERLGPGVALRGDANQAWTLDEASAFAEGAPAMEYVEEPLRDPADLPALWFDTGLPIALDESLAGLGPGDLVGKGWAAAVVLKPTLLGGVMRTLGFARQARALGIRPVLSGAFESGVAMRAHVALAAATGGAPAGLDPYRWLAEDVLAPRLPLDRPWVDVPGLLGAEREVALP
jgi:o-succinylbenzoate synthase